MIALPRYFGLPSAMLRHLIVLGLAGGAVVAQGLVLAVPIEGQFLSWVAIAIGVGVASALLARGAIGVLFVIVGSVVGLMLTFAIKFGATADVARTLGTVGVLYLEIVEVAALAYLLTAIAIAFIRPRGHS